MCRLLGYVATEERTFADVVGEGFENFVELSKEHKHGWGISACSTDTRKTELVRDLTLAAESKKFAESSTNLKSDGALLHLRLASKGLTVDLSNNHPFIYGDYSFMHNGTIKSIDSVQKFVDPRYLGKFTSTTDSERYFFTILSCIDELGLIEGVRKAVKTISANCDFTSINSMLMTPDTFIAVCEFNEADSTEWTVESHYELRYSVEDGVIKVASTGWGKDHWTRLTNHSILVVNRKDLSFEVLPL
ncbi:class II glutamine amidotransferase [Candidatus Planktophila lacus]|jgi:predicted glutamine amidotransferase|uniref:Glutamine amidotransferase n=1 Tax=Candidatus Planktophila lacus TaxID=1884913 RepID=A0AAC9YQV7_9ACTN|nr:class II glutamine amidotransferase [Candidatus Planktophila lacus]ASY10750.1 putative glutamine amidotransferase [Candidatus Planktophila lacus]